MKICHICEQEKPDDEFPATKGRCRGCYNKANRESYEKNKVERIKRELDKFIMGCF